MKFKIDLARLACLDGLFLRHIAWCICHTDHSRRDTYI